MSNITFKTVAIITRTKNRPILLKRAMESVRNQSFKDYVWVVINDGGQTSELESIVVTAKNQHIDVTFIDNKTSMGMEAASNNAMRSSNSKYIVIHDDDDSWENDFLKETVGFLESDSTHENLFAGVIAHSTRVDEILENNKCTELTRYPFNNHITNIYLDDMAHSNSFPPISFLFKREVYEKIGGYDEELPVLGDWDFNIKFLLHSNIGVINKLLANYHHRLEKNCPEYGNTVIHGIAKHYLYDMVIRNKYLRNDVIDNKFGIGYLINLKRNNQYTSILEQKNYQLEQQIKVSDKKTLDIEKECDRIIEELKNKKMELAIIYGSNS